MDKPSEFILAAINDTQATIRAIDIKVAAILVAIMAPLQNVHRVVKHLEKFSSSTPTYIHGLIIVLFLVTWLLALICLVRAISAVDNPSSHIISSSGQSGIYFSGGLFSVKFFDAFINRDIIKANKDPASFFAMIPNQDDMIAKELAFEQMKLVYIREIKMNRLRWGLNFSQTWFVLGVAIYVTSKYIAM